MKFSNFFIFLFFALLLATPNWSVWIAVLMLVLALKEIRYGVGSLAPWDKVLIWTFVLYFASGLPNFFAEDFRGRILDAPSRAIVLIPLFLYLLKHRHDISSTSLATGIFTGAILSAVVALYEMIVRQKLAVDGFLYSITFSYLAASLALLSACYFPLKESKWWKALSTLATCSAVFACFSTASRGGMLALPMLLLIPFVHGKVNARAVGAVSLLFVFTCTLFILSNQNVRDRIVLAYNDISSFDVDEPKDHFTSTGIRFNYWLAALRVVGESPITGMTYRDRIKFYNDLVENENWPDAREGDKYKHYAHAHSEYFEAMASKGLLGLGALLLLYFVPLIYFFRNKPQNTADRCNRAAGILFVLAFCIFGISEAPLLASLISVYYIVAIIIFWALLAPRQAEPAGDSVEATGPAVSRSLSVSAEKTLA